MLTEECVRYVQLLKADQKDLGSAARYVKTLVDDLGFESALPLLLSVYSCLSPSDLEKVSRWLIVFVTRFAIIAKLNPADMETVFFVLAKEVRTYSADPAKVSSLLPHIKSTLAKNAPDDTKVELNVRMLELEPEQAGYVMERIAGRMQSATKETELSEANVERIFPKKPSNEWTNKDELKPLLWHIGNLTMLGERLNKGAANKGYTAKRVYYQKVSELVMAKELGAKYSKWDAASVVSRAESLIPYIVEIWNFDNPSRV